MLTLTIVTILGGAVLGLRYKIFILLPAATFMLVFVIGVRRCARSWHLEDRAEYDGRHDGPAAGLRRRERVCCGAGALQEWSYSHQPARSIFSTALNFRRSAIAALVRSPWRCCPFRSPRGPPL